MKNKEKKFKDIISEFQDTIYRLCYSYVEDKEMRKDLYQNILIRIWKGLDTFKCRIKLILLIINPITNTINVI